MTTCQQIKYDSIISFPRSSVGKEPACNAEDLGSVPGSGRSPGEGNGNPLQYSCLENPMDREAWRAIVHGAAKSRTQLTNTFNFIGDNRNIIGGCVNLILL